MSQGKAKTAGTPDPKKAISPSDSNESVDQSELKDEDLEQVAGGSKVLFEACATGVHLKEATITH